MKYIWLADAKSTLLENARRAGGNTASPESLIGKFVNVFIWVIGAVAVISLIIAGLRYVLSGGDSKATADAKNHILYSLIGLAIALAAGAMVKFVIGRF